MWTRRGLSEAEGVLFLKLVSEFPEPVSFHPQILFVPGQEAEGDLVEYPQEAGHLEGHVLRDPVGSLEQEMEHAVWIAAHGDVDGILLPIEHRLSFDSHLHGAAHSVLLHLEPLVQGPPLRKVLDIVGLVVHDLISIVEPDDRSFSFHGLENDPASHFYFLSHVALARLGRGSPIYVRNPKPIGCCFLFLPLFFKRGT